MDRTDSDTWDNSRMRSHFVSGNNYLSRVCIDKQSFQMRTILYFKYHAWNQLSNNHRYSIPGFGSRNNGWRAWLSILDSRSPLDVILFWIISTIFEIASLSEKSNSGWGAGGGGCLGDIHCDTPIDYSLRLFVVLVISISGHFFLFGGAWRIGRGSGIGSLGIQ